MKTGTGSADDMFMFFTIKNNEVIDVGEMSAFSSWLSEKDGNLYTNLGHSGYQMVERIIFDGSGISTETISEGEVSGDYTIYGTAIQTTAMEALTTPTPNDTDSYIPYVEIRVETYDYSGLEGSESRLYVDGNFDYISVERVDSEGFSQTVGTYHKSECGDYINLCFNAYADPGVNKVFVTPFNKNGTAGNVEVCEIPRSAANTVSTQTIGVIPVDQKGQIAIYDGGVVCGYTSSYVCESGACTKVRESLGDQWHVTAKNKCYNYNVEWYELWDTDDGDYYGWVDANYIMFY